MRIRAVLAVFALAALAGCGAERARTTDREQKPEMPVAGVEPVPAPDPEVWKVTMSEEEWRKKLTPEQYHVAREGGTEYAYTGKYWDTRTKGVYRCVGCGQPLFSSETKYASGTGWPSFWDPIDEDAVAKREDRTDGMVRVEVVCSRCGSHLGHVFEDGPQPTGLRYCLNSAALDLKPADTGEAEDGSSDEE